MSQNSTVTCLRSPSRALLDVRIFSARCFGVYVCGEMNRDSTRLAVAVRDLPQPPQNFSPPSFRKPHEGHVDANDSPHSPQKRRPSRFSAWHRGQTTISPTLLAPSLPYPASTSSPSHGTSSSRWSDALAPARA